ncbi:hypothetical protein [Oligosphaera ethanolica]|uniref:Uncharacterized protein n=1 Tax=Oligosphaera ethanolica TaxID=760260 RepID=A0AAE3VH01_9BACT|nr:hypothetical protein [Oligosphaera ethanolica]MDQ0289999.1 hypothetical protein [Oligosphaera ethanolica]
MVTNQLIAGDCRMLCEEHCSYEIHCLVSHLWVMAGGDWPWVSCKLSQRSAGVYTDRLRAFSEKD